MWKIDLSNLSNEAALAELNRAAEQHPYRALSWLLYLSFRSAGPVAEAANSALTRAVLKSLPELTSSLRHESLTSMAVEYGIPRDPLMSYLVDRPSFGVAAASCFSVSGYIRERAVLAMSSHEEPACLPFLMLRTCDWVPLISVRAGVASLERMKKATDEELLAAIGSAIFLESQEGITAKQILHSFEETLRSRPSALRLAHQRTTARQAAWLLDREFLTPETSVLELIGKAVSSGDPFRVRRALNKLRQCPEAGQVGLIGALFKSPVPIARQEAIEIARHSGNAEALWRGALDSNWRTRNNARFYLEKLGGQVDFEAFYRSLFPDANAVAGFGEVAAVANLPELLPFISNQDPKVRLAAVKSLGARQHSPATNQILERLGDDNPKVVRAAVRALEALRIGLSRDEALAILAAGVMSPAAQHARVYLLHRLAVWDRLIVLLRAVRSNLLDCSPSDFTGRWITLSKRFIQGPTESQLELAEQELESAKELLSEAAVGAVRGEIVYWRQRFIGLP